MDTAGRPNLRTSGACHQGTLTRFPLVARWTLRTSFKGLGGALEGGKVYVPLSRPGESGSRQLSLKKGTFAQRVFLFD